MSDKKQARWGYWFPEGKFEQFKAHDFSKRCGGFYGDDRTLYSGLVLAFAEPDEFVPATEHKKRTILSSHSAGFGGETDIEISDEHMKTIAEAFSRE